MSIRSELRLGRVVDRTSWRSGRESGEFESCGFSGQVVYSVE
jgi:hypothetical protein